METKLKIFCLKRFSKLSPFPLNLIFDPLLVFDWLLFWKYIFMLLQIVAIHFLKECFVLFYNFFQYILVLFFYFRWDTSISIHVSHCLDDSKCVHIVNYWHILGSSNVSEVTVETIWKKHLKRIIAKLYHML